MYQKRYCCEEVLAKCLATGGDFAEIFEDSINNSISLIDGRVENAIGGRTYGIGIRIFKGLKKCICIYK
ncbi:putative Zn-dependent protease [Clostridium saccharobutylicum]|nr:putative Zn-dependent protease [Clostridium saccharobutylicum]